MESVKSHNDLAKRHNSRCPNCFSKDIVKKFKRNKGSLNGYIDGSSCSSHDSFLFHSSSYHNSSIDGKIEGDIDTIRVNKCNHCGNEWEIMEEKLWLKSKDYYFGKIDWKFNTTYFIKCCILAFEKIDEFNPSRLDEECNTIEEKIEQQVNYIKDKCCYEHTKELPLEVLYYYLRNYDFELHVYDKNKVFAPTMNLRDVDKYMGKFNNRLEKFLIEHFGFKYHFSE
jgi:DNA-directed RNA polymerase subunit RPC12/RpoP